MTITLQDAVEKISQGIADPDIYAHRVILADIGARIPRTEPDEGFPAALRVERLHWLIETAQTASMALDKLARWTGYVQGVACARGWLDAEEERIRTRPVFHAAAQAQGKDRPRTLGPEGEN